MPTAKKVKYEWRGSAPCTADAQKVGQAISDLDEPVPRNVVEAAREDEDHPLHDAFEWDERKAAWKQWKNRARQILASLKKRVVVKKGTATEERSVRAFVSTPDETGERRYRETDRDLTVDEYDDARLRMMRRRVRSLRSRFDDYDWFHDAMSDVIEEIEKRT